MTASRSPPRPARWERPSSSGPGPTMARRWCGWATTPRGWTSARGSSMRAAPDGSAVLTPPPNSPAPPRSGGGFVDGGYSLDGRPGAFDDPRARDAAAGSAPGAGGSGPPTAPTPPPMGAADAAASAPGPDG